MRNYYDFFYDEKVFLVRCNFWLGKLLKINYDPDLIQILSLNKFCNSLSKFVLVQLTKKIPF